MSLFLLLAANAQAQPHYSQVLQYAEKHNPTLQAATKRAEAEKTAAHLGTLLPNPEIGAAYYWGDPAEIGKRWDMHVTQSFDMPSVMIRKARLRNLEEQAAELNYQLVRTNLLLEIQHQQLAILHKYLAIGKHQKHYRIVLCLLFGPTNLLFPSILMNLFLAISETF